MRTILGYAVIACIGFFAIKLIFGLLGFAITLLVNLLWLAAIGFVFYLILRVVSPAAAQKIHDAVKGRQAPPAA
jgi:predicted lipid-binding transport protein (Tim44 family)